LRSVDIEEIGALGTIFRGRIRFELLVRGEQISDSRSQREREREREGNWTPSWQNPLDMR
jgi:hypothetical protein